MLADLKALDQTTLGVLGALLLAHIGSLVSAYLSIRDRLTRIETKQDEAEKRHDRDLDNLAQFVGTERAKSRATPLSPLAPIK